MNLRTSGWMLALALLPLAACEVEQTQEGELPEAEDFRLPEYDVDGPDVDIGTDTATIEVPDIDVDIPTDTETIEVPDVDVR